MLAVIYTRIVSVHNQHLGKIKIGGAAGHFGRLQKAIGKKWDREKGGLIAGIADRKIEATDRDVANYL